MIFHFHVEIPFGGSKPSLNIRGLTTATMPFSPILTSDCTSIAIKSKWHTSNEKYFITTEIKQMFIEWIIDPSHPTLIFKVFITCLDKNKTRMVIDYLQTINKFTLMDIYLLPPIDDMFGYISKYFAYSTLPFRSAYHPVVIKSTDKAYALFDAEGQLYKFC